MSGIVERLHTLAEFLPEQRSIFNEAAGEIERLRSIAVERMDLFRQAASKVEEADTLLLAFVAAYQQQDADNFTDAMRNVYAAADLFVSGADVGTPLTPSAPDASAPVQRPRE
jgi:hypothetical protein